MGVSATGQTGIRPRTVRVVFVLGVLVAALLVYTFAPPVTPGIRQAAEDKCNSMNGANYRSFRVEWVLPKSPNWDPPHWICKDMRDLNKPGVDFGWWVNPFADYKIYPRT